MAEPSCRDVDHEMEILTDDHRRPNRYSNFESSSTNFHAAHSKILSFSHHPFSSISLAQINMEGVPTILGIVFDISALFEDVRVTSARSSGTYCLFV